MHASSSKDTAELEQRLGYNFRNRAFLDEALTHKSFHHEKPGQAPVYNERLEFLGDSVLGLVIVEYVFAYRSEFSESVMSKIKSFLVKGTVLSEIAKDISLGDYLRLGRGEDETGGRKKQSVLADALEAVFGAVYLDGGFDEVRRVILGLFGDRIPSVIESGQYHDYKTELQELSQNRWGMLPEYRLTAEEGDEHQKVFTVEVYIKGGLFGTGTGKSKKEAQTLAAKEAIGKAAGG